MIVKTELSKVHHHWKFIVKIFRSVLNLVLTWRTRYLETLGSSSLSS